MTVTSAYLGVSTAACTYSCEVKRVHCPRRQIGHTAAQEEVKHRFRKGSTCIDALVDTDSYIALLFYAETEVQECECYLAVNERHAVQGAQESLLVTVRVKRSDGLARLRVHIQHIRHRDGVVTDTYIHPAERSEVDVSFTNRLKSRVDGMAHRSVLQEIERRLLLRTCAYCD